MINKNELSEASLSSINLGIEKPDAYFLSDEDNVRLYAIGIGLNVISTIRVLEDAAVKGEIKSITEMTSLLYELKKNNYPVSDEMIADIIAVVENRIKTNEDNYHNEKEKDFANKVISAVEKIEENDKPLEPFKLFGIEHYYGWYGLTLPVIEEIRLYNKSNPDNQIQIRQIKQKFGSLRIYVSDCPDYIEAMIAKAEYESKRTCEICGAGGKTESINDWYWTLCEEHKKAKREANHDSELEDKLYKKMLDIKNYGWNVYKPLDNPEDAQ